MISEDTAKAIVLAFQEIKRTEYVLKSLIETEDATLETRGIWKPPAKIKVAVFVEDNLDPENGFHLDAAGARPIFEIRLAKQKEELKALNAKALTEARGW